MSIFRKVPLTHKMMIITLVVGVATWGLLDPMHRRAMRHTFGERLSQRLEQEAYENRLLFDGYVDRFMQSAKILISQRSLQDYVSEHADEWASVPPGTDRIIYHDESPAWLPKSSLIRTLPDMHYVFLLDKGRAIREVFMKRPEPPPGELLKPGALLLQLSHQQAFMTELNYRPYLVASESLSDKNGNNMATLLLAGPMDDEFIRESQGAIYSKKLVALVGIDPPVILSSSHPEILAPGTELKSFHGSYLYTGRGFFDYGSSDLQINFTTFLPRQPYELLSESILAEERRNRMVTALMLILSFSVLMFWVTKRVQNVTSKVRDFAEVKLKMKQPQLQEGDEIEVLEQRLRALSREVIISHESIKEQARQLRRERDRAQNYLDIAASVLLVIDSDHKVVMINRKGCDILGYEEDELTGRDWFDTVLPPGSREDTKAYFQELVTNKSRHNIYLEFPVLTKKGEMRLIGWHNTLLQDEAGGIGVLGSGEDVTDRRKAEEELWQAHQMLETRVSERTAELEKANILLQEEIHERMTAEKKIRDEAELRQVFMDALPCVALLLSRETRRIVASNKSAASIGAVPGNECYKTFGRSDTPCPWCQAPKIWTTGQMQHEQFWGFGIFWDAYWVPVSDHLYLHYAFDITESKKSEMARRQAEQALKKEKEKLQKLLDISAVMVVMLDREQNITLINKKGCDILGVTAEDTLGKNWFDNFLPEKARDEVKIVFNKLMAGEIEPVEYYENEVVTTNGEERLIAWYNTVFCDESGKIINILGAGVDITERRNAESQIKASLKEKEVLLQEIHHRVKNNMTVISSLLKLQADKVTDEHFKELFNESTNRIKTMALIHEKLYRSDDLARIVFSDYLKDMMDDILDSYGIHARKVFFKKDLERVTLSIDTSIPCGLIVNELLSNSLKYAFPHSRTGEIRVSLRKNNGNVELTVGDDGVGLPADMDFRNTDTLGLNIVNALVRQVRGNIELRRAPGTEFLITFRSDI